MQRARNYKFTFLFPVDWEFSMAAPSGALRDIDKKGSCADPHTHTPMNVGRVGRPILSFSCANRVIGRQPANLPAGFGKLQQTHLGSGARDGQRPRRQRR